MIRITYKTDKDIEEWPIMIYGFFAPILKGVKGFHGTSDFQFKRPNKNEFMIFVKKEIPLDKLKECLTIKEMKLTGEPYKILEVKFEEVQYLEKKGIKNYKIISPLLLYNTGKRHNSLKTYFESKDKKTFAIEGLRRALETISGKKAIIKNAELKEQLVIFKRNQMLAFLGNFETNVDLPDYIGIGKKTSFGYGTIKKIE